MSELLRPGVWPEIRPGKFAATLVDDIAQGDVVLVGFPDDTGVRLNGGRPGAAGGPTAFRAALARFGVADPVGFDWPRVHDAGDVVPGPSLRETHDRVTEAVCSLCAPDRIIVAIGGGHDLTFPLVRAVSKTEGTALVGGYLDPHLDVREQEGSGMPFRRLLEEGFVKRLWIDGMDERLNSRAHAAWFLDHGGTVEDGLAADSPPGDTPGFFSLDLDALPASSAPGVSSPNPVGTDAAWAHHLAQEMGGWHSLRCFDIMELSPPHDEGGRTSRLAASLFLSFLRGVAERETARNSGDAERIRVENSTDGTLITNARVLTMGGPGVRAGAAMRELGVLDRASVRIEGDRVVAVAPDLEPNADERIVDIDGRVVMPGFVDCHTHACWAGSRVDEWQAMLSGRSYLELLEAGGGIMSTVRAVRAASQLVLAEFLIERLLRVAKEGTTTIEVKSGYGLDTESELKMLRAIADARHAIERCDFGIGPEVFATACIGHAIDPDVGAERAIRRTIDETLPAVSAEFPGITIDAYCEPAAWPLEACLELFDRAAELGHPCRVHADQFTSLGLVEAAAERGFRSVDHLEASSEETLRTLAASATIGVVLPVSGAHLDQRYASARTLVDAGGRVAIATNYNPGSAPSASVPMAISLAARHCGLMPDEAITAATVNAAGVLGLDDRGCIAPGARADLVILDTLDERDLAFEIGGRLPWKVFVGGQPVG
ncbi:MAG: imidazolonepropionase [Planctomycetota bacterium]